MHTQSLLTLAVPGLLLTGCEKEAPAPKVTPRSYATAGYVMPTEKTDAPLLFFNDVTAEARIDFHHYTGAFGKKWMPETIGSGGGFLDYDNDGLPDVFLVNGCDWPGHTRASPPPTMKLYHNLGDGTFEDVTAQLGLNITCYGMGAAFADYDADGDTDIYVTTVGDNILLRNDGSRFTDVTAEAGTTGNDPAPGTAPSWSTGVTWVDVDRDGRLDLFVANYVKWTPETDIFTTLDGKNKSYALPQQYDGQSCRLYRNTGDGRFQDVTSSAGVFNDNGKSLGVVADDFNDDGWPDLFITNDTQPNFLYINNGDGTFVDRAFPAGCGYDDNGRARAGMGVDVADINNDGVRCIAIGNFTGEPVSLYAQIGDGLFQDYAGAARLVRTTLQPLTFGVLFADFDLDGYSDLVIANGHVEPQINTVRKEVTFAQRPMLFHNNRHGQFTDVTDHAGPPFVEPIVGRGVACADYDADGDLDLLITVNGGATKLLRNDTEMDGAHWVKLRLQDTGFNIQAIGAKIVAEVGDLTIRRYLRAGSGYLAQSTTDIVLGLGRHEKIDRLTIHWPDGSRQLLSNVAASTTHRITRAGASAQP